MSLDDYLEIAKTTANLFIPLAILFAGNKIARAREIEKELLNFRIEIYKKVLEPYLFFLTPEEVIKKEYKNKTMSQVYEAKLLNTAFQNSVFDMLVVGSDEVIKAYNNLMQSYYGNIEKGKHLGSDNLEFTGLFILAIRKSLGNEKSKINAMELLEWKLTDVRKQKIRGKYPKLITK